MLVSKGLSSSCSRSAYSWVSLLLWNCGYPDLEYLWKYRIHLHSILDTWMNPIEQVWVEILKRGFKKEAYRKLNENINKFKRVFKSHLLVNSNWLYVENGLQPFMIFLIMISNLIFKFKQFILKRPFLRS